MGMRSSQWQWLMSSLERPNFSEPKSSATFDPASCSLISCAADSSRCRGRWRSRWPTAVVPTTRVQSADRGVDVVDDLRLLENVAGAHGGTGFLESHLVRVHETKIGEAEIAHGASGGADVQGIARRDENDP